MVRRTVRPKRTKLITPRTTLPTRITAEWSSFYSRDLRQILLQVNWLFHPHLILTFLGLPFRSPFQFNNLAPFLASLQQQQQNRNQRSDESTQQRSLEQQMLALAAAASSSSHLNSDLRADSADSTDGHSIEPEDLSL